MKQLAAVLVIAALIAGGILLFKSSHPAPSETVPAAGHFLQPYSIQSSAASTKYSAQEPNAYSFSIADTTGNTVKDFAPVHTKLMHIIVVRKDLAYFQHLHPEFNPATGIFSLSNIAFPAEGEYRIFADFTVQTNGSPLPVTIFEDVTVGDKYVEQTLGSPNHNKIFGQYEVTLAMDEEPKSQQESTLAFSISKDSARVTDVQEYLGALGHSVIIRAGTLDFIHAHPAYKRAARSGQVNFTVHFPEPGNYKAFTQFKIKDQVLTTDFVISVTEGATGHTDHEAASSPSSHQLSAQETETTSVSEENNELPLVVVDEPAAAQELYTATAVVDGDTIDVSAGGKTQRVRYIGIDTPETVHPSKDVQCFGADASAKNKELVLGKQVRLVKDISATDRYGRLLRYVYLESGLFVNLELVAQGYATVATFPPDVKYSSDFVAAQQVARDNNRGLWANCRPRS